MKEPAIGIGSRDSSDHRKEQGEDFLDSKQQNYTISFKDNSYHYNLVSAGTFKNACIYTLSFVIHKFLIFRRILYKMVKMKLWYLKQEALLL